jgi:hypothetical protein
MNERPRRHRGAGLEFPDGIARPALANSGSHQAGPIRIGLLPTSAFARSNPLPVALLKAVPALATCGNLTIAAPAALPVRVLRVALPVPVLPVALPVQVSQAPELAAMSRRLPELHLPISPTRN